MGLGECLQGKERHGAAKMLTAYINAALRKARYEILPEGEGYCGAIEGLQGIWAQADTLERAVKHCVKSWKSGSCWDSNCDTPFPRSKASR
jgi:hypothetical protein